MIAWFKRQFVRPQAYYQVVVYGRKNPHGFSYPYIFTANGTTLEEARKNLKEASQDVSFEAMSFRAGGPYEPKLNFFQKFLKRWRKKWSS